MLNRHGKAAARLAMTAAAMILVAGCGGSGAGTTPSAPLPYGAQTASQTLGTVHSSQG
jgi:Tfp pilus assembly pilus retraction ATPase PilT